jgi:hypothetical protein
VQTSFGSDGAFFGGTMPTMKSAKSGGAGASLKPAVKAERFAMISGSSRKGFRSRALF